MTTAIFAVITFGKDTQIRRISNSVSHLFSFKNATIKSMGVKLHNNCSANCPGECYDRCTDRSTNSCDCSTIPVIVALVFMALIGAASVLRCFTDVETLQCVS